MAYLTGVNIEPFRGTKAAEIDLRPTDRDRAEGRKFLHLILTGPNGSGKTSVAEALVNRAAEMRMGHPSHELLREHLQMKRKQLVEFNAIRELETWLKARPVEPRFEGTYERFRGDLYEGDVFVVWQPAARVEKPTAVTGPKRWAFPRDRNLRASLPSTMLQYLVNQRTEQAFAKVDHDQAVVNRIEEWFATLLSLLRRLFEDSALTMEFDRANYNFVLRRGDGHTFDLHTLAEGQAAALALVSELLLQI